MSRGTDSHTGWRRVALTFLTLSVSLSLLVGLELALRAIGFGSGFPLFVAAPDRPGYLEANPDLVQRYYDQAPALAIDPVAFRRERAPGSTRLVVQGGSTAAGFPYGLRASLAGALADRLAAAFPEREIEVVSTAMSAVNTNTLRDLVDEVVAIEPDAVLIYAGHNEYLGILGVASSMSPARWAPVTRAYLALRRLRLYQLVRAMVGTLRAWLPFDGDAGEDERSSLMAAAAAGALVPLDSPLYERGIAQYSRNLEALLERYAEAGIPVYLGTLVSNEGDQPPFESRVGPDVDREARDTLWRRYERDAAAGATDRAREALASVLAADDGDAAAWYALGQLERKAGDPEAARAALRKAKDRDQLRFRAPEAFNAVVRDLAARHAATLVDVQARFAQASPDGIVGHGLMLEHLHPNEDGYFLLADAYYEALRAARVLAPWPASPTRAEARADMPLTALDRIRANRLVAQLKSDFPFRDGGGGEVVFPPPSTLEERLVLRLEREEISWLEALDALLQDYRRSGRSAEARVVARVAAESYPTVAAPNFVAGMLYLDAGEPRRARRYLARSVAANPDDPAALQALARTERLLGDAAGAATHRARLRALGVAP